eukprot:7382105-Karenia_brevis.AAC.1
MLQKPLPSSVPSPEPTSSHSVFGTFACFISGMQNEAARTSDSQVHSAEDSFQVVNIWPTQAYKRDMDVTGAVPGAVIHGAKHCTSLYEMPSDADSIDDGVPPL